MAVTPYQRDVTTDGKYLGKFVADALVDLPTTGIADGSIGYVIATASHYALQNGVWWIVATGGLPRRPAIDNPPASTHAYSDEFDALTLNAKWTPFSNATTNPIAAGTAGILSSLTTPIYDPASMPSHLLLQSDSSSAKDFGVKQTVTIGTNATLLCKVSLDNRNFNAANEGIFLLQLINSGDTNETVSTYWGNSGTGLTPCGQINNNGTLSVNYVGTVIGDGNPFPQIYLAIWKSGNNYWHGIGSALSPMLTLISGGTKTGVTTLNEVRLIYYSANETPSAICSIDFFRWYDSIVTSFVNP